jgi:hypothetical protein
MEAEGGRGGEQVKTIEEELVGVKNVLFFLT